MDCVVIKTPEGLEGLGEQARRGFERWRQFVKNMAIGETLRFSWKQPRSPGVHKRFFVMLGRLFDMQEQFADDGQLRSWLTVGAGYADFVPGPTGRMVAMPKSIAWERMDETAFQPLVESVWAFMRTDHAQAFLWPMASPQIRSQGVESLLAEFEGDK